MANETSRPGRRAGLVPDGTDPGADRDREGDVDPLPMSRYGEVSRRAFLRRAAAAGAGATALGVVLAACGHDDASVFAKGADTATTAGQGSTTTSAAPGSSATAPTTATTRPTSSSTSTTAPSTTTTTATPSGSVDGTMTVSFTYQAAGGNRVRNPYVAVWVEDANGELVDTVALWYLQGQKGRRWLPELRRWAQVDGSDETIQTVSSATRAPGTYSVTWDLRDVDGQPVPPGTYYVCIESAREHGPYSLIRQEVTLGSGDVHQNLGSNGELSGAKVDVVG